MAVTIFGASFRTLHFAVRPRVLCRYTGQILLVLAALTTVPAGVSWLDGRTDIALRYACVIALFAGAGFAGARLRCAPNMQPNEAMVVSALVFLIPGLAMAFPLSGYGIPIGDAIFESISGVTTTGLSTLGSIEDRPRAFLFARAWLQWVGGLGVVVLALAFMIPSGVAAKRLGFEERETSDYVGGTRGHARRVLVVYVSLTVGAIALCAAAGLGPFDAVAYSLSAVSTGGFAPKDGSLGPLPWSARAAVSVACLAGAVPFSLYYGASLRRVLGDARLWTLLALTAASAGVLALVEEVPDRVEVATWRHAVWMAISAQTTAGFSTLGPEWLSPGGRVVVIAAMLVGGEVGSTAGGLKILRMLILTQLVVVHLLRMSTPRSAQIAPRLGGRRIQTDEVAIAAALALAYMGVVLLSWFAFVIGGHEPLDALFDVASAIGTVGLSTGVTGPDLAPALKALLCVVMLLGRVELFAFFVLVFPATWIGRRRRASR